MTTLQPGQFGFLLQILKERLLKIILEVFSNIDEITVIKESNDDIIVTSALDFKFTELDAEIATTIAHLYLNAPSHLSQKRKASVLSDKEPSSDSVKEVSLESYSTSSSRLLLRETPFTFEHNVCGRQATCSDNDGGEISTFNVTIRIIKEDESTFMVVGESIDKENNYLYVVSFLKHVLKEFVIDKV
jgi:hypothetical protein